MSRLRFRFRVFLCMDTLAYTELWYKGEEGSLDGSIFNEDYLARLVDRDDATERHFITHFSSLLRIKLRCSLRSSQDIVDVMQETFRRVFQLIRTPHSIHQPDRLPALVSRICTNVMLELFRGYKKYQGTGEEAPEQSDDSFNPERALETERTKKIIRKILEEMPEKDRRILRALYLEEREKDDICREFEVDRDYLRVLVHRALGKAREIGTRKRAAGHS